MLQNAFTLQDGDGNCILDSRITLRESWKEIGKHEKKFQVVRDAGWWTQTVFREHVADTSLKNNGFNNSSNDCLLKGW